MAQPVLSVVIPVHNEAENIRALYGPLRAVLAKVCGARYEIIFIDDGSMDATRAEVTKLSKRNKRIRFVSLSRNFGKEIALAAGIRQAAGQAIITLDGDGQHPVERLPEFVSAWQAGAQVVIGVRTANKDEGWVKKYGSKLFYTVLNRVMHVNMVPGSSDFRLIDRAVRDEFIKLEEPNTMTRALIDWLGFKRVYINYAANARAAGTAGYKFNKLFKLAANSFVSLSPTPLYAFGYLGLCITGVSFILGLSVIIEQLLLNDPLHWKFTGTAMLSIMVLFLVGLILVSQGVLALYISAVHAQTKRRPLYVIDHRASLRLSADK